MPTIPETIAIALQHLQNGRLQAAEQIYREILAVDPQNADVWNQLGIVTSEFGKHEAAIEFIQQAIRLNGTEPSFYSNLGRVFKSLNRIDDAIACYRRVLEMNPHLADTNFILGNALKAQGKLDDAMACFRRAIELKPDHAAALNNLGSALWDFRRIDEAGACYLRAVELKPDFVEARCNLGNFFASQGKLDEAIQIYREIVAVAPLHSEAWHQLGILISQSGNHEAGIKYIQQAIQLNGAEPSLYNSLGKVLKSLNKFDEAIVCYRRALEMNPHLAETNFYLGNALTADRKLDEAIAYYRRALELKPDSVGAYNNLGNALRSNEKPEEAVACFRRALELKPDYVDAHNNLGGALKDQAKHDEAVACYRRAMKLRPDNEMAHGNLLYLLSFHPQYDAVAIYQEHRDWNEKFGKPLATSIRPHVNSRIPDRRLRIGYVSPDFCTHVVGRNLLPLFREHDHQRHEIFAYSSVTLPDAFTAKFQSYCDAWRDVTQMRDDAIAETIRADRIDVLVDLTLHMAKNHLAVFARKPAPVQVMFAGYPGTTGLTTIDYRLTDPYLDPPGLFDAFYSEESIRLPESFWCYDPLELEPLPNPLPAATQGYVTFGCLNNFTKTNDPVLSLWADVLRKVESSRLLLLSSDGHHRQDTLDFLAGKGITPDRVSFVSKKSQREYLETYHQIDVGLDTFPYNGHTTSLDSLWMGVPVITLVGQTVVGCAGVSQLSNLGATEWIAESPAEFVRIAAELSRDLPHLAQVRSTLREKMQTSPLMNPQRFTRNVENAYRQMWERWCARD